jgi:hypothetical protein
MVIVQNSEVISDKFNRICIYVISSSQKENTTTTNADGRGGGDGDDKYHIYNCKQVQNYESTRTMTI